MKQVFYQCPGGAGQKLSAVIVACSFFVLAAGAWAQKVTAELSQEVTAIGQPVQLNISVEGGAGVKMPEQLNVDGLDIQLRGQSSQVNIVNFQVKASAVYSYLVVPRKTGDFVIPAISVSIGGKNYSSAPLTLRVSGNSGGMPALPAIPSRQNSPGLPGGQQQGAPQPPSPPPSGDKLAFGDMIIPKKTAYVGEVIPVEMRFYFPTSYPFSVNPRPNFSGNGFTVMNFSQPTQRTQDIDGQTYNVVILQTAITPVKSGDLVVSPASVDAQMQLPGHAPAGMDDFFGSFLANSGFGGETRQITVPTKAVKLEVKPLPTEGRPEDFSGAIGQFSMADSASPKKAGPGEPITLSVVVSGRGNFEGMSAPALMDADAWKTYPPSEKFKSSQSDPIGFNGQKTFEYMIVARTDATLTPSPEFSFFDPAVEKYVTLKSSPIAVFALGGQLAATRTAAVASATPAPSAASTPAVPPAPGESLATNLMPASFQPFAFSHDFLVANGVAALAWLLVVCIGAGRAMTHSSLARKAAQKREAQRLLNKIEDPDATAEEAIHHASEFVRFRLAPEGSTLETRELLEQSPVSAPAKENIRVLLDRGDEWRYSTNGLSARLGADERQKIVYQLKTFDEELRH